MGCVIFWRTFHIAPERLLGPKLGSGMGWIPIFRSWNHSMWYVSIDFFTFNTKLPEMVLLVSNDFTTAKKSYPQWSSTSWSLDQESYCHFLTSLYWIQVGVKRFLYIINDGLGSCPSSGYRHCDQTITIVWSVLSF